MHARALRGSVAFPLIVALVGCAADGVDGDLAPFDGRDDDAGPAPSNAPSDDAGTTDDTSDAPSCSDGIKNQSETDVDCGGPCGACDLGRACRTASDCASATCTNAVCCTTGERNVTTGPVSGHGTVCCGSGETLVGPVVDCGHGHNHSVSQQGDCGVAHEGDGNDGSACAQITCEVPLCSAPDAGASDASGGG